MFEEGVGAGRLLQIGPVADKCAAFEGRYNGIRDCGCFEHLHFVWAKVVDRDRPRIGQNRTAETWHFDRSVSRDFQCQVAAEVGLIGIPELNKNRLRDFVCPRRSGSGFTDPVVFLRDASHERCEFFASGFAQWRGVGEDGHIGIGIDVIEDRCGNALQVSEVASAEPI